MAETPLWHGPKSRPATTIIPAVAARNEVIMCISSTLARQARAHFQVALGVVAVRLPEYSDLMSEALDNPCPASIRRVLEASRGQPWRESVLEAVAEVRLAASAHVLGGDSD